MIYNRRPYSYNRQDSPRSYHSDMAPHWQQSKPPVQEDTLQTAQAQIERKTFHFALKENPRGRLLRITEEVGGRRNSIIIPSTGLAEFARLLAEMVQAAEKPSAPE